MAPADRRVGAWTRQARAPFPMQRRTTRISAAPPLYGVNDAISAGILGVTTIDRPPRVEAVSVTEGLDETDGEQCRGHLRAARPCACAETEPRQVAPPGFVRYRRQETAACWRRKASSMTLLRPSGQPGWRPLLTLGVVGRDGQPGYGSVAASRLIDAGARSVVGADIDV